VQEERAARAQLQSGSGERGVPSDPRSGADALIQPTTGKADNKFLGLFTTDTEDAPSRLASNSNVISLRRRC
jgi:hypothetical protein